MTLTRSCSCASRRTRVGVSCWCDSLREIGMRGLLLLLLLRMAGAVLRIVARVDHLGLLL
jgi:hypothetical protein